MPHNIFVDPERCLNMNIASLENELTRLNNLKDQDDLLVVEFRNYIDALLNLRRSGNEIQLDVDIGRREPPLYRTNNGRNGVEPQTLTTLAWYHFNLFERYLFESSVKRGGRRKKTRKSRKYKKRRRSTKRR
jgi:hypothetical protein